MVLSDLFTALFFLFGGLTNRIFADPKCDAGVAKLNIAQDVGCGCLSDLDDFPSIKGVATCNSRGIISVDGSVRGDSAWDQSYGQNGRFNTNDPLVSRLLTDGNSPGGAYELQVVATPDTVSTFGSCTASIFLGSGLTECTDCSLCPNKLSFTVDCANLMLSVDAAVKGPTFSSCLNFSFQPADA